MGKLSNHQSRRRTKILMVGEQGTGKTSAYASLANAGYRLFIIDTDDGLDNLVNLVDKDKRDNVNFVTITDDVEFDPKGRPMCRNPKGWSRIIKLLNKWTDPETGEDFGPIAEMGTNDVVIVDSLTRLGGLAMNQTLKVNKRIGKPKRRNDWGDAIEREEALIAKLTGDKVKCNVVLTAHLKRLRVAKRENETRDEEKDEILTFERYPSALGQQLPPNVGSYFNVVVQAKAKGTGKNRRYVIRTQPDRDVSVKVPSKPDSLDLELPNETALVEIFKTLQMED